ncbi:DUF1573 domain-containing protein [Lacipirellula parvula]|uniref:Thioredoxin domain-containing protein n=1 Tax=Lacipirellula parvula TaxID=2650471 RepID=A0A5K7XE01_9BACT|nr:DUF1573 domain-containing protein [Lacipirellula parvula]BBO34287.1 hypothetical protein PLANPX_3899 [Lacipirellula parvula]
MSLKAQFALLFAAGLLAGVFVESHMLSHFKQSAMASVNATDDHAGRRSDAAGSTIEDSELDNVRRQENSRSLPSSPRVEIDDRIFDFGERDAGDVVEHAFKLTNSGQETLLINRVLTSCSCTTAEVGSKSIPPGGSTTLNVKLDLHLLRGPQNRSVLVQSNDPRTPALQLDLKGNSIYHVDLSPPHLALGDTKGSEPFSGIVTVTAGKGIDALNVEQTRTSGDNVEAELEAVEEGKRYLVKVKVKPQQEAAESQRWVKLMTDHPGEYKEINIPILTSAQLASSNGVGSSALPPGMAGPTLDAKVGETLELEGVDLAGAPISLTKFTGKPTAVIFWASTCNACKGELSQLKQLHADYHEAGFQVLGVSLDKSVENRQQYLNEMSLPWDTIVSKDDGMGLAFAKRYKVRAIPSVVLIDGSGKVVAIDKRGPALRQAVSELLSSAGGT